MPLAGCRVVVTRAEHQAAELGDALAEQGARPVYMPVITIADPRDWSALDGALADVARDSYPWILFTSSNAVAKVWERMRVLELDRALFAGAHVAAVGSTTRSALRARGVEPELVPEEFTAAAAVEALGPGAGRRVLMPRAEGAPRAPIEALAARGWRPHEVAAYRNEPAGAGPSTEEVRALRFEAVTFTSPSTVRGFVRLAGPPRALGLAPAQAPERIVACIGPQTAAAARALGLRVDATAAEHSTRGLVAALVERLGDRARMAP